MSSTLDLFEASESDRPARPGLTYLPGLALPLEQALLAEIGLIAAAAPFRHMLTPGGQWMSAAMTNCGEVGWVTDRMGYRYDPLDPRRDGPGHRCRHASVSLPSAPRSMQDSTRSARMSVSSIDTSRAHGWRCTRIATSAISHHLSYRCRSDSGRRSSSAA